MTSAEDSLPDNDAMLAAASSGDADALADLLEQYLPALRAFVRLNVSPRLRMLESCSDLVQSTCRQVLEHSDEFEYRGEAAFRSWLFRRALMAIHNRVRFHRADKRDAARAQRWDRESELALFRSYSPIGTPSRHAEVREEIERMEAAFDRLPADYREVITLAKIAQASHTEIAAQLDRTPKATRNLLNRALAKLAGILWEKRTR